MLKVQLFKVTTTDSHFLKSQFCLFFDILLGLTSFLCGFQIAKGGTLQIFLKTRVRKVEIALV